MLGYRHLFSFYFVLFSLVLGTAGWLLWGAGVGGFVFGFILNTFLKFMAWFISRTSDDDYICFLPFAFCYLGFSFGIRGWGQSS